MLQLPPPTRRERFTRIFVICLVLCLGAAWSFHSFAQTTPDALSILYTSINAQQANFPLPTSDATVTVGTIHVGGMGFRRDPSGLPLPEVYFEYSVPTYSDGTFVPSPPCKGPIPRLAAGTGVGGFVASAGLAVHCPPRQLNIGGAVTVANIRNLSLRFAIDGWPANYPGPMSVTVTLGSGPPKIVQAGATEIVFPVDAATSLSLKIDIVGAITVNGRSASMTVPGTMPVTVNRLLIGIGAVTIPALPVSLIYAPVVDPQQKNSAGLSQSNWVGNSTSLSFSSSNGTASPTAANFQNVVDMTNDMKAGAAILSKIPNPIAQGVGAALSTVAGLLGTSTASVSTINTVTRQHTLSLVSSATVKQTAFANQGGPGVGDLIYYYLDARVIWYSKNGQMQLALLGYDRAAQLNVGQLSGALRGLQHKPAGTLDPNTHLDASTITALLALDPFVAGGAGAALPSPRFVPAMNGPVEVDAGQIDVSASHQITTSDTTTTSHTTTTIRTDNAGFLSFLGLGVTDTGTAQETTTQTGAEQTSAGQIITQQYTLNGDGSHYYSCEIYFDTVFGVFAFRDVSALAQQVRVGGVVVDRSGRTLADKDVSLNVDGKTYLTKTDSAGIFAFRLPGLAEQKLGGNGGPMMFHVNSTTPVVVRLNTLPH
jgi:hypothetical protein